MSDAAHQADLLKQGIALHQQGNFAGAGQCYMQLLAENPDHADALHLLGVIAYQQKDYAQAEQRITLALKIKPGEAGYQVNLASVYKDSGRLADAQALLRSVLAAQPNHAHALYNLGCLLVDQKRHAEALPCFDAALTAQNAHIGAQIGSATSLGALGRDAEAEAAFTAIVAAHGNSFEAYNNWGVYYKNRGRLQEAAGCFHKAVTLNPGMLSAYHNLAFALYDLGRLDDAMQALDAAVRAGDSGEATYHKAMIHLLRGNMSEGLKLYEARWKTRHAKRRPFVFAQWNGAPLTGKTLLLTAEQGIGDELMFAGMVPPLLAQCKKLVIECDPRLVSLFTRSFAGAEVIAYQNPSPLLARNDIDLQVSMGDLLNHVQPEKNFAPRTGYLKVDADKVKALRAEYDALLGVGLKIGVSWYSSNYVTGKTRSVQLADWEKILRVPNAKFISVQYGDFAREIAECKSKTGVDVYNDTNVDALASMEDLATQIAALDLVISVANSTVHMAGALGIPVWVLIPQTPSWRWQLGREDSIWYPHIRLFRQQKPGEWEDVVEKVAGELGAHIKITT